MYNTYYAPPLNTSPDLNFLQLRISRQLEGGGGRPLGYGRESLEIAAVVPTNLSLNKHWRAYPIGVSPVFKEFSVVGKSSPSINIVCYKRN